MRDAITQLKDVRVKYHAYLNELKHTPIEEVVLRDGYNRLIHLAIKELGLHYEIHADKNTI